MSSDVVDPGSTTLGGANPVSSPAGNEALKKVTVPEKPPNGFKVRVELFEPPATTSKNNGLAETVKPGPFTVTIISRKCTRGPLLAIASSV